MQGEVDLCRFALSEKQRHVEKRSENAEQAVEIVVVVVVDSAVGFVVATGSAVEKTAMKDEQHAADATGPSSVTEPPEDKEERSDVDEVGENFVAAAVTVDAETAEAVANEARAIAHTQQQLLQLQLQPQPRWRWRWLLVTKKMRCCCDQHSVCLDLDVGLDDGVVFDLIVDPSDADRAEDCDEDLVGGTERLQRAGDH